MAGTCKPSDDELRKAKTIVYKFRKWCAANPEAVKWLYSEALAYEANHRQFSVRHLVERLRWDSGIALEGGSPRVPNIFTPIIARCLVIKRPKMYVDRLLQINASVYDWLVLPDVFGDVA